MPGPNEWEQYYQKTFMDNIGLQQATPNINGAFSSDSTIVATSSAVMTENMKINSPSSSYNTATTPTTTSSGQLTPTGSVSKPIRRRSRVSKKTPITLLNANANNFRALVQQFTGCSTASTPMSFGNQKGPINLSFGLNNNATNAVIAPFGNNYNSNSYHHQQLQQQQQQQQQQEQKRQPLLQLQENQQLHQEQQQQCMYPFDNISGGYNPMALETVDGLVMDQEDIALNDFSLFTN